MTSNQDFCYGVSHAAALQSLASEEFGTGPGAIVFSFNDANGKNPEFFMCTVSHAWHGFILFLKMEGLKCIGHQHFIAYSVKCGDKHLYSVHCEIPISIFMTQ